MHKLMEFVCDELEELERKAAKDGKLSRTDLEDVKDLSEVKKNLLKIDMLSGESEYSNSMDGYSRRNSYYSMDGSYANDGSMDFVRPDGSYRYGTPGASYARGRRGNVARDSMGRYSRAEDEMTEGLMRLAGEAPDEQTRSKIMKLMEQI